MPTISFIISVRPSVRMKQLGSHWTDFHEIWYSGIFRKSVEKIQVSLKSDGKNRYFTWGPIYICYLAHFFLEWEMFQSKVVEKIKTHFVFSNFFFFENLSFYEKIWKDFLKPDRPQKTTWRMRITCRIPKSTGTHTQYAIHIACPLQQWLNERAWMLRYTYVACLVFLLFLYFLLTICLLTMLRAVRVEMVLDFPREKKIFWNRISSGKHRKLLWSFKPSEKLLFCPWHPDPTQGFPIVLCNVYLSVGSNISGYDASKFTPRPITCIVYLHLSILHESCTLGQALNRPFRHFNKIQKSVH
jgi:hypothetical protein